jgi:hypothetical protein
MFFQALITSKFATSWQQNILDEPQKLFCVSQLAKLDSRVGCRSIFYLSQSCYIFYGVHPTLAFFENGHLNLAQFGKEDSAGISQSSCISGFLKQCSHC